MLLSYTAENIKLDIKNKFLSILIKIFNFILLNKIKKKALINKKKKKKEGERILLP
jgi:hypothetical protein